MSKPIKYLSFALGGTLLVVLAAVGVFLATFDPNAYKSRIVDEFQRATGRSLAIPGELGVELFPWLALRTGAVSVGNASGFGDAPFATLEGLEASVKVLPLLRGKVEVGAVRVSGLRVALVRRADGSSNWDDLGGQAEGKGEGATAGGEAHPFSVAELAITDAALTLDDAQAGRKVEVSGLELTTGEVRGGEPTSFAGGARVAVSDPQLDATLKLEGTLATGEAAPTIGDLVLELDAKGTALPAPLEGGKLAIARLALGTPLVAEQVTASGAGLELAAARVEHGAATGVSGLRVAYLGLVLEGGLEMVGSKLTAKLASQPFEPRAVLAALGIEAPTTADPKALAHGQLGFELMLDGDRLALEHLTVSLDQTKLAGRVALESIEHRALRFDLDVDAIDLDRYLPPPAPTSSEGDGGLETVAVPADAIRDLDLAGALRVGKLHASGLDLTALRVALEAKGGRLEVAPFSVQLYGGKASGRATLDARGKVPAATVVADVSKVQVGDLMQALVGKVYAKGTGTVSLDLAGSGATLGAIEHDLDGTVRFEVSDGSLEGFNVWKQVRLAWAKYKKRETPAAADPDRTEFSELRGGANLAKGVATLDGVRARIRFAEATAVGTVDLNAAALAVTATARIDEAPVFGPGEDLSDLKGAALPIDIKGPFASPKVGVDFGKVAASLLKAAPKEKAEEALKKKLKGIFR